MIIRIKHNSKLKKNVYKTMIINFCNGVLILRDYLQRIGESNPYFSLERAAS